jgi:hypothetical protein
MTTNISKAAVTEKLQETAETARAGLATAKAKVGEGVDGYPVAALLGGLAVGVALGALLPRTRKEADLLGPIGSTVNDRARSAINAARDAGQGKLDELGLSTNAAGKQVGKLIESVAEVAEVAGSAAVDAIRTR